MSKRHLNTGCLPAIIITAFATTIIINVIGIAVIIYSIFYS